MALPEEVVYINNLNGVHFPIGPAVTHGSRIYLSPDEPPQCLGATP